jgi:hypothetical protein
MSSQYDENLLASAPQATKAQLQGGYNPDILVEQTSSIPASPAVDPEVAEQPLIPAPRQSEDALPLTKKKVPYYATTKGIIIIVILVVVVIGAVVGGAVGGTRKKKTSSHSTSSNGQGFASTSASNGQGRPTSASISSIAPQVVPVSTFTGGISSPTAQAVGSK